MEMRKWLPHVLVLVALGGAALAWSPWAAGSSEARALTQINGFSSYEPGPVDFTPAPKTVASLRLPAGKFLVSAKAVIVVPDGPDDVTCELGGAGGTQDTAIATQLRGDGHGTETIGLQSAAVLHSAGVITVRCRNSGGTTNARFVSVTAIKVTSLRATTAS
jgi:hypothetical protein